MYMVRNKLTYSDINIIGKEPITWGYTSTVISYVTNIMEIVLISCSLTRMLEPIRYNNKQA